MWGVPHGCTRHPPLPLQSQSSRRLHATWLYQDLLHPPPFMSRWARWSRGRCWLQDTELFACLSADYDPLSCILRSVLHVPAWHHRALGLSGASWAQGGGGSRTCPPGTGAPPPGHPRFAATVAQWSQVGTRRDPRSRVVAAVGAGRACVLRHRCAGFVTVRLMLVIALGVLSPECFLLAPETNFSPDLLRSK